MKNKFFRIFVNAILTVVAFTCYFLVEKYLLIWIYSSINVGITVAIIFAAALTAFLLSGKIPFIGLRFALYSTLHTPHSTLGCAMRASHPVYHSPILNFL